MTNLVVRRLLVHMEQPIPRHWCASDPLRTAFFNALSMSFPSGEQFFIDSVREGWKALPADKHEQLRAEVQGFIGQEATHRRLHDLYNQHLAAHGLVNEWELRARERMKLLDGTDVRHALAVTAANEHFTSILAAWMLAHADALGHEDERLRTLWLWHSAEESEHRNTAFDVYKALGGNEEWRLRWFRRISVEFLKEALRQTLLNLKRDGTLWKWATWRSAWVFFLGRQGVIRKSFGPWRDYFKSDFHPRQHDDAASRQWLADNQARFVPVSG